MATVKEYVELIKEIQKLNQDVTIELDSKLENPKNVESFYTNVDMNKLQLPPHFKIHPKYGITNQGFVGPFTEPIYISVDDINKVKSTTTHDISLIKNSGYTEEEEKKLEKDRLDAMEKAAIEAELAKKNGTTPAPISIPNKYDFSGNDLIEPKRKIIKNAKSLKAKVADLYERVRKGLKYTFTKSSKAGGPSLGGSSLEEVKENEKLAIKYDGKSLDDLTTISKLVKRIEPDDYMMAILKRFTGNSIEDELKENPHELAEIMRDVTLMGELHEFAKKDPKFDGKKFDTMAMEMVNLRRTELRVCNKILQQVRYGDVKENQMQFLEDRIKAMGKDFTFPEPPQKPAPGGNNGGNNGGPGLDNPEPIETPQAVMLDESDKLKADLMKQFGENKLKLINKLGDYEKAFVEDAAAEGLDLTDIEFRQMMNERALDKNAIYNYYAELNELRNLMTLEYADLVNKHYKEKLDDIDRAFVEDVKAEGLVPGDAEFNMMLSERTVNKPVVLNYYKELSELQKYQNDYQRNAANLNELKEYNARNFTEQNVTYGNLDERFLLGDGKDEKPYYNSSEIIKEQRKAELEELKNKPKLSVENTDYAKVDDLIDFHNKNFTEQNVIIGSERPADYNSTEEIRKIREAELQALAEKAGGRSR
ncbi:MAG: hypothetical protein IKP98_00330 [Bacilli bacterium]|nr:hypothetical protein [Bacilli bacterium]